MKNHSHQSAGIIESLEPRLAPAGIVTLSIAGGVLTITGDGADNGIAITHLPGTQGPGAGPGVSAWQISDPTATGTQFKFNGATLSGPFNITAQEGIKADLKDGNDRLDIVASAAPSGMVLGGVLSVIGGKGNDIVNLGDAAGPQLVVGGAATFDLGDGDDLLDMDASVVFGGAVTFKGGAGADDVILRSTGSHTFLKGLSLDMGAGEDAVVVQSTQFDVLGALAIKGAGLATKDQTVTLTPTTGNVEGATTVGFAAGLLKLNAGVAMGGVLRFNGGLTITGGADVDTVNLNGAVTVGGALNVDLKNGTNSFGLGLLSSMHAGSFTLKGGTGVDQVTLNNGSTLVLGGALTLTLGDGTNILNANASSSVTAASVAFTGGKDFDNIKFAGSSLTVTGNMTLTLGAGGSVPNLQPTVSGFIGGNLTISAAAGVDNATLGGPDFRILGNLSVLAGDGGSTLILQGAAFQVGGNLLFTGGKDADTLVGNSSNLVVGKVLTLTMGEGANSAVVQGALGTLGSVIYKGGAGTDALVLGAVNGTGTTLLTVTGGVTGTLGAGTGTVRLTDTLLHGAVNVTMAGTTTPADEVTLRQSTFNGVVNIIQGASAVTLSVQDSLMRGNFTAKLGGGADTLNLDTEAGTADVNTWMGTLYVDMDTGVDTINIGSATNEANARNHFYRLATIDTGAEADVYVPHNNHTFFANSELRVQET